MVTEAGASNKIINFLDYPDSNNTPGLDDFYFVFNNFFHSNKLP